METTALTLMEQRFCLISLGLLQSLSSGDLSPTPFFLYFLLSPFNHSSLYRKLSSETIKH